MKHTAIITLLLLAAATFGLAAGPEDEIITAEKAWARAVTTHDFVNLERMLSPELIYAHSTGVIETKEDYLGKLKSGVQKYTVIDHQKTTVKVHGDSAVAHSIVVMKGVSATGPFDNRLMMIHFWIKGGGKWQLVAHQTTKLTQ